jgi:predicted ATPase
MLTEINIANYKSINNLKLPLGRVNVFIGENGAGKSNILEAIALAGAANAGKLDNEFLVSRGIRVTQPELMRPAFADFSNTSQIVIAVDNGENSPAIFELTNDNTPYAQWRCSVKSEFDEAAKMKVVLSIFDEIVKNSKDETVNFSKKPELKISSSAYSEIDIEKSSEWKKFSKILEQHKINVLHDNFHQLNNFVIYSPENSALRIFEKEGQIEPLGINGEGLLKLLSVLGKSEQKDVLETIKSSLHVLDWFKNFDIVDEPAGMVNRMEIEDRFLAKDKKYFDQKSANEGFLFLVFYFALFSTDLTPKFFAIDNIDVSLNPKLCQRLIQQLVLLSKKNDKQVLLTTHNPAVLDGLNLDDDEQRLFVVSRNELGQTKVKRVKKPRSIEGAPPTRLSEAFLRGALGGLPKGF